MDGTIKDGNGSSRTTESHGIYIVVRFHAEQRAFRTRCSSSAIRVVLQRGHKHSYRQGQPAGLILSGVGIWASGNHD